MIKLGFVLLIAVILVQGMLFWKYQRQVKALDKTRPVQYERGGYDSKTPCSELWRKAW